MEKFSRDSNISLSFANVNATHLSLGLRISKKLRGKDINETLLFFQKIERGKFQFCMAKTTSAGECKLPKNEIILFHVPSLASFTATGFTCYLLVNKRPASQEAVVGKNLSYIDLFGCLF